MINKFRYRLARNWYNLPGWRTERKIVVIESDDWGSIRMPSREVYDKLLQIGIRVDKCPYNRYDSLASEDDLTALFDVLTKFKDKNGNNPVITANCVVANPDFERIRNSCFQDYHYELVPETLKKYPNHEKSFALWTEGLDNNIFYPQFHGREHVNINFWLERLVEKDSLFRKAFNYGLWGLGSNIIKGYKLNIQASFDSENPTDIEDQKLVIEDGLNIFRQLFGYKSKSFIANNFVWDDLLYPTLLKNGVLIIQGMNHQYTPVFRNNPISIKHFTGELNSLGQLFLMRNCYFEPSVIPHPDPVDFCMNDIQNSFLWHKPAIISSHRINFIGSIVPSNRDKNLLSLSNLLSKITTKWPEVEFMTSENLGHLITKQLM